MKRATSSTLVLTLAAMLCGRTAVADVYMHNPRGSNDRNCERNVNRNNGNRLFDSQNNAKGGYACPRATGGPETDNNDLRGAATKMYYYSGSMLPIEWTNQHGCGEGNDKLHCEIILQYACEEDLDPAYKYSSDTSGEVGSSIGTPRDGIPRDANDAATDTIPNDEEKGKADTIENRRYGMHETVEFYQKCKSRERNKGLFTADQNVKRRDATGTRQNPNGNRRGLECPEERDHYPYWAPAPWVDIAALVSNPMRCHGYCTDDAGLGPTPQPTAAPSTAPLTPAGGGGAAAGGGGGAAGGGRQLHGRRLQLPARCTGANAVTPPSNPANANGNPSFWSDKDNANGPLFQTNLKVWEADGSLSCEYLTAYETYKATCRERPGGEWVDGILAESQNVKVPYECDCGELKQDGKCPNNKAACDAKEGATWKATARASAGNRPPPKCIVQEFSRVNHLGNGDAGYTGNAIKQAIRTNTHVNDAYKVAGMGSNGGVGKADFAAAGVTLSNMLTPTGEANIQKWMADGKGTSNANRYMWEIPAEIEAKGSAGSYACALRMRYNISTFDYAVTATAELNGKKNSPVTQDPYVTIGSSKIDFLSMALNTNQYGRTFQDRSYAFEVKPKPAAVPADKRIFNLNVRGKRGNIVQTYPSVEYDFVPNTLQTEVGDRVHFQWTGSDYNPRRGCNNGEGGPPDPKDDVNAAKQNSRADRSNLVLMNLVGENLPTKVSATDINAETITTEAVCAGLKKVECLEKLCNKDTPESLCNSPFLKDDAGAVDGAVQWRLMFLDQDKPAVNPGGCLTQEELDAIKNKNQRENHPRNCAKLNAQASPHFDLGQLVEMRQNDPEGGRFHYYSSRNNNFSNRDQTGTICVKGSDKTKGDCSQTNVLSDKKVLSEALAAVKANKAQVTQLPSDVKPTGGPILTEDTAAPNDKDNDALGDGDQEGCERMVYDFFKGIGPAGVTALAVGLLATGSLLTLLGLYVVHRYRRRHTEAAKHDGDVHESRAWLNPPEGKM